MSFSFDQMQAIAARQLQVQQEAQIMGQPFVIDMQPVAEFISVLEARLQTALNLIENIAGRSVDLDNAEDIESLLESFGEEDEILEAEALGEDEEG